MLISSADCRLSPIKSFNLRSIEGGNKGDNLWDIDFFWRREELILQVIIINILIEILSSLFEHV